MLYYELMFHYLYIIVFETTTNEMSDDGLVSSKLNEEYMETESVQ